MFVVVEAEDSGMMGTGIIEHTLAVIQDDRRGIFETSVRSEGPKFRKYAPQFKGHRSLSLMASNFIKVAGDSLRSDSSIK